MSKRPKAMLFILTEDELEDVKRKGLEILKLLPDEPKTALLIVSFMRDHLEQTFGLSVGGIAIHLKEEGRDG